MLNVHRNEIAISNVVRNRVTKPRRTEEDTLNSYVQSRQNRFQESQGRV